MSNLTVTFFEYNGAIGAGLAKGDWNIIQDIINDSTPDLKVSVFYL